MKFEQKKVFVKALVLFVIGVTAGAAVLVIDIRNSYLEQGHYLERPMPGEGTKEENVQVQTPYGKQNMQISVEERKVKKEEIMEQLQQISQQLGTRILGENLSPDEVRSPLYLMEELEDLPVSIVWSVEEGGPVNRDGSLNQEDLPEEGVLADLTAKLMWEEEVLISQIYVRVYPRVLTTEEEFQQALQAELKQAEESSRYDSMQELPEEINGQNLNWQKKIDYRGILIMLLGAAGAGLLLFSSQKEEQEKEQKRNRQMEMDYPEIVSKLKLYMESGLTCRSSFMKIAGDYQKKQEEEPGSVRPAYEEMVKASYEMRSGSSEQRAYERFGERCQIPCYKKLSGLLIQNVRKGNRGLLELLEAEMWQAFEERKALAKRQGEEAGTKLLFPMMGLLAVVMVIVIAPALLSMQI